METLTYAHLYLRTLVRGQDGQDLAEYGLLVALIAIVVIGAVLLVGGEVQAFFASSADEFGKISGLAKTPPF